jgi:hypothetical protein
MDRKLLTSGDEIRELFMSYVSVEPMSGCWLWLGTIGSRGYGSFWDGYKNLRAHRVSYIIFKPGGIPDGLELDHKCRLRCCVNPDHLEPVTSQVNQLRSPIAIGAVHARRTHCPQGHPLIEGNLRKVDLRRGARRCLACFRVKDTARKKRRYHTLHPEAKYLKRGHLWAGTRA